MRTKAPILIVCSVALLSGSIALRAAAFTASAASARQGRGGGGGGGLVPITASTIAREPFAHVGENVSMMATVDSLLSKTVFTVDQDKAKSTGQEILVIAPTLATAPELNTYLTIQGEVIKFDPDDLAKRARNYKLDLSPELVAKYKGRPAVLATAVINSGLVDLAKKPIVPPTPEEVALSGMMKTINSTVPALRTGLDKPDAAQIKDQVAALKKAFTDADAIFAKRGMKEASGIAGEALKLVATMEQGAAAAKWEDVKTAAGGIQPLCTQCHGQFRDRMDDGTYRIKSGG